MHGQTKCMDTFACQPINKGQERNNPGQENFTYLSNAEIEFHCPHSYEKNLVTWPLTCK